MGCGSSSSDSAESSDILVPVPPPPHPLRELLSSRKLSVDQLEEHALIGIGTYGRVTLVTLKDASSDQTPIALKRMNKNNVIKLEQVEHVKAEKKILAALNHPFIVQLLGSFQDKASIYMVLDFVNGGELHQYIQLHAGQVDLQVARLLTAELFIALEYLHSLHIVHRDVKPSNILLTFDGHSKLTDFGFAKVVEGRTFTFVGTPEYVAPEIIRKDPKEGHAHSVDWWAFGVVLYEIFSGFTPFVAEDMDTILDKVTAGLFDFVGFKCDPHGQDLIKRLLLPAEAKRIPRSAIRKHKWFKALNWAQVVNREVPPAYVPSVKGPFDTTMFRRGKEEGYEPEMPDEADQIVFSRFSHNSTSSGAHGLKQRMYPDPLSQSMIEQTQEKIDWN